LQVLDSGRLVEFDEPYLLLLDNSSLFYKLVSQTGKSSAVRLLDMARTAFEKRHQPEPTDAVPDHLKSNMRAFIPASGVSDLQIESTL